MTRMRIKRHIKVYHKCKIEHRNTGRNMENVEM